MTDKEKIRAEVDWRIQQFEDDHDPIPMALKGVRDFIDSLPEEYTGDADEIALHAIEQVTCTPNDLPHARRWAEHNQSAFEIGKLAATLQREQIVKNAVDITVGQGSLIRGLGYKGELKAGEKVKLIIIKED